MASFGTSVFFMYDKNVVKEEADDPKDAILYFYPSTVSHHYVCGHSTLQAIYSLLNISMLFEKLYACYLPCKLKEMYR